MRKSKLQQIAEMELGSKAFKFGSVSKAREELTSAIYLYILSKKYALSDVEAMKVQEKIACVLK